jgi:hypothetical protein
MKQNGAASACPFQPCGLRVENAIETHIMPLATIANYYSKSLLMANVFLF